MAVEGEVGAARITFGAATGEQAGGVEDLEVVREQVGWDREGGPQLGRGPVNLTPDEVRAMLASTDEDITIGFDRVPAATFDPATGTATLADQATLGWLRATCS
ncbi:hypothetical protein [Nostocoides jenkinsii]|uniref:Uncharacterized protein n=1 Tax=Nostocoides jenkinsii Ben 74 TaxID=1193518 RepID=A0A077M5J6_9MICO|nr:hypothetical protein [Tetrasphaera jenkinsii]CCI51824.1 hypothetical protein BN13_1250015 [Tetrasphaera jenkinsii Ben 74]